MSTDIGWGSTDQQAIDQYVLRPQRSLQYRYYHHSNEEDEESSSEEEEEEEGGNDFCLQTQDIFNAVYYISFREQIEIGLLHVHTPSISLLIVESMKFSLSLLSVHCNVSLLMIKLFCFWMIKSLSSQKMILFTFLKIIGKESHAQQSATKMNGLFKFSLHFNKKNKIYSFLVDHSFFWWISPFCHDLLQILQDSSRTISRQRIITPILIEFSPSVDTSPQWWVPSSHLCLWFSQSSTEKTLAPASQS